MILLNEKILEIIDVGKICLHCAGHNTGQTQGERDVKGDLDKIWLRLTQLNADIAEEAENTKFEIQNFSINRKARYLKP